MGAAPEGEGTWPVALRICMGTAAGTPALFLFQGLEPLGILQI